MALRRLSLLTSVRVRCVRSFSRNNFNTHGNAMSRKYLLWFAHEHVTFRHAEMHSILSMFNIKMRFVEEPVDDVLYWIVEFDSEESAMKIASRSISLRWCFELWGRAKTVESIHKALKHSVVNNSEEWILCDEHSDGNFCAACPRNFMQPYYSPNLTFKITVETFCKHFKNEDKIKKIENFNYMPFQGSVSLKSPDVDVALLEYYGLDPNTIPDKPHDIFVGRKLAEGQRHLITKLSLKNRKFIGNTSMDAQLSVLMANQAQIMNGDTVIDPFVGSGSLLVAAAEFGGYVWGADIDFLMLHGRSRPTRIKQKYRAKDESIRANMEQYNIQCKYLDVVVSDFSLPLWKDTCRFDAIIADPPYGIREATEKIGIERKNYSLLPEHLANHIPSKIDYNLSELFKDLLKFAVKYLHVGRRLVFWYPCYRDDYNIDALPKHPCLRLVANSEQILSKLTSRRLLTYEKISDSEEDREDDDVEELLSNDSVNDDPNGTTDFRTKYFLAREQTRRERKEESKRKLMEKLNNVNGKSDGN